MFVKGIRGATTVLENTETEILAATEVLLKELHKRNNFDDAHLISIFFTMTQDLNAAFPARAARALGLNEVPLLCATEVDVPGALPKCIRVLFHVQFKTDASVQHVYLNEAVALRPDLDGQ